MKPTSGDQAKNATGLTVLKANQARRSTPLEATVAEVKEALGEMWLPEIYRQKVVSLRTRAHSVLPATKNAEVSVQHTLLGVELKVGRRRQSCPDLATARYLSVFARIGCSSVAVPYDITRISRLADDLEFAWHRMLLLIEHHSGGRSRAFVSRVRTALISNARQEIEREGAGPLIPKFNQNTKQRKGHSS